MVFSDPLTGQLTTGYEGIKSYVGTGYDMARSGVAGASGWSWKNELQQSLVRQARRLPYEVPAFYVADKTVGKSFRGDEKSTAPRKKWYDPSRITDFGKDLAKTTALQMGGFMLPTALAGASKNSSVNFLRTAERRWDSSYAGYSQLTPVQKKLYQQTNFLRGSLNEVGQDVFSVLDKGIKFSERSAGAMSAALSTVSSVHKNPVGDLYAARHGVPVGSPTPGFGERIKNIARDIYRGDKEVLNGGLRDSAKIDSLLDLIPGYKSVRQGLTHGYKEYKNLESAQYIIDKNNLTKAQEIIVKAHSLGASATDEAINPILRKSIDNLNRKRSSPLVRLAKQFEEQVGLRVDPFGSGRSAIPNLATYGRGSVQKVSEDFKKEIFDSEYKKRLAAELSKVHGVDEQAAKRFSDQLFFDTLPYKRIEGTSEFMRIVPEERLTLGGRKPESDFFQTLINRYNEGKIGSNNQLVITKDELRKAIDNVDLKYEKSFSAGTSAIYGGINVGKTADQIAVEFEKYAATGVLKQKKLQQSDFDNTLARLKSNIITKTDDEYLKAQDRLIDAVADTLGVPKSDRSRLLSGLRDRGIDTDNIGQMQGYLLRNKKMTASQFGGLSQFFGGKGLALSAARGEASFLGSQQALFDRLRRAGLVRDDGAGDSVYTGNIAFLGTDKISSSPVRQIIEGISATAAQGGGTSTVKGFYQFGNQIVNFNPVFAGARKATEFLSNEVRVPIIGINPLQMLGFKDFQTMSQAGKFRVTSAVGSHPFVPKVGGDEFSPDLYTWSSTGGLFGTKGKLTAVRAQRIGREGRANPAKSIQIAGTYRPLSTQSAGMFTRTAELAAGERTTSAGTATGFLDRVKQKLDYDPDQPNSLFRFFGRLRNRQSDINNEAVMARLISGKVDEPFSIGGFGKEKSVVLKELRSGAGPADEVLGYELRNAADDSLVASHGQLMEAFTRFADTMLTYGFNKRVSAELLRAADSPLLTEVLDTGVVQLRGFRRRRYATRHC